jgi:hypothetical protein
MGPDGDPGYIAFAPRVAYQPLAREFPVVWEASHDDPSYRGYAIYGQHVGADGRHRGTADFPISAPEEPVEASSPAVASDPTSREYLVGWSYIGRSMSGRRVTAPQAASR